MINKKAFFKSLIIISLLIVIIFVFIQIRNTLARYETTATTERNVDVAFWMIDTSFASNRILISEIYPSDTPYEYTFTVSNFNGTKRAETDLEYEIVLTTTTNLPFEYEIQKEGVTCTIVETEEQQLIKDTDGTYYRKMTLQPPVTDEFILQTGSNQTDNFKIKLTFPKENNENLEYADLIEYIKLDLSAKQIIGE